MKGTADVATYLVEDVYLLLYTDLAAVALDQVGADGYSADGIRALLCFGSGPRQTGAAVLVVAEAAKVACGKVADDQ